MNRAMTSLFALGLGVAAYQLAQRNDWLNNRSIKKMRHRLAKAIR
ncbi:YrzQ family protein [Parageobacillus thermoglucosidasius]|uniref:DUF3918 domain-containing protein n=1 Tax=Geobacillus sp. (strain Y4.1MC1) TaxID=581103 RepID=A0A7U3YDS3_GEOS0|nr:YrzQ family protein [Parageobacillus thermoglucosidasius]KYD13857.1 hypothetical protein B4168_0678 [Anoxybacillus flavithermus]AEH47076.1 hypothetical protein Geoth_1079 [Parageobacillus thermoglucosidasius C56-YS93]MBY6267833.1 DUF3918 domain-containing protein [Parageobacillus thermoglucosidasius]MED4905041.1 YrzQ family protein [Parageobacillus thermoglucosidasius]MED4913266.1 YrzQ family protein [Parageobacillus thermoglucosidasius]